MAKLSMLDLRGDRELEAKLLMLGEKVYNRHLSAAVTAGCKPIVAAARSQAPVDTGMLKKSLGSKISRNRRRQTVKGIIGPRFGFALVDETHVVHDPAKIAHAVEFGHGGPAPAAARPFLRPAVDGSGQKALTVIRERLAKGLQIEAKKRA
ncbi:MAG: HK97 gp10 family phage protein [Kiritimatiellae bacterium]|nr:HK97 gp10 family phage protein [Kiritimatiellia bacterium]